MRILHTADLHLGSPLSARLSGERQRERKNELFNTLSRMADKAKELGCGAVIIAGDLFDSESVTLTDCERVLGIIERYPMITYFYVSGNHERGAFSGKIVEKPNNLIIFGEEWEYYTAADVRIVGRSGTEEGMLDSLAIDREKKNIVILHGEPTDKSGRDAVGLKEAMGRGIDYLALGHYHSYRVYDLGDCCHAVYPGSPEGRGFDEEGEKGFVLIDTDGEHITHRFVPFAERTLHRIEVDIGGSLRNIEIEDRIRAALSGIPAKDLVRVELVGALELESMVDTDAIYSPFKDKYYHFEIKDRTNIRILPESYKLDKSLRGEFIRLVSEAEGLSDEDRAFVATLGIAALMGEPLRLEEVDK